MNIEFKIDKLPIQMVESLNQTYLLHLLATEEETVIPSGKSLLSLLSMAPSHLNSQSEQAAPLHDRVEQAIHSAFWKQALESLLDPTPSIQIERLKGLLSDVREAIAPLFPKTHPILATLATVPPTASPLISISLLFKDVLKSLRERAAPVRDSIIDGLLADLDAPLSPSTSPSSLSSATTPPSPLLVVNTTKSIMALADSMKADISQFYSQFSPGSMTDTQLRDVVKQQAKKREKELVLDIWGENGHDGQQRVQSLWRAWVNELQDVSNVQSEDRWTLRLVQALGSTTAVSCIIPELASRDNLPPDSTHDNRLPPQFFFAVPRLLYAQNYLQALVVAASLRSLTHLPPLAHDDSKGHDFMERVWTLLKAEIDDEDPSARPTKVINFADEVVRARQLASTPDENEEVQLRAAVDRTLRYEDPVFLLLHKRLLAALAHHLDEPKSQRNISGQVPAALRTGRAGKLPRLAFAGENEPRSKIVVKGFEDPILIRGISDVFEKVYQHAHWADTVWSSK
ncbi:hypothetical protein B0H15DRAFT_784304 [Mycena belliarum]|uniref:Uncharacterized protein n=1 Tax=Mycena belliarum TaxID=1033014 RepID=A0AAD6TYX6_9AGAR|nr:hypothetical protein B0H15DRAFT_784304 [Mycena belliae]